MQAPEEVLSNNHNNPTTANNCLIGLAFASIFVDDFIAAREFYTNLVGLTNSVEMGPTAAWFPLTGECGIYLLGGRTPLVLNNDVTHTSFCFEVPSAGQMFSKMKAAGVKLCAEELMDYGNGLYWFQCADPAGNLIEFLGKE